MSTKGTKWLKPREMCQRNKEIYSAIMQCYNFSKVGKDFNLNPTTIKLIYEKEQNRIDKLMGRRDDLK